MSGAVLGGGGSIAGPVAIASGANLTPSMGAGVPTTLTIANNLTVADGSVLNFNVSSTSGASDLITVGGNLSLGAGSLNILSGGRELSPGNYPLIDFNGSLTSDNSTSWTVASSGDDAGFGHTYSFVVSDGTGPVNYSNQFELVVSAAVVNGSASWVSTASMGLYDSAGNWSPQQIPSGAGLVATFPTTQPNFAITVAVGNSDVAGELKFTSANNSTAYTLSSGSLTLDNRRRDQRRSGGRRRCQCERHGRREPLHFHSAHPRRQQ